MIYVGGSLTNPHVPRIAGILRDAGHVVFDDWYAPGPDTDKYWRDYEVARGRSYIEALNGQHCWNAFLFDQRNLDLAEAFVAVAPFGKSCFGELCYMKGRHKGAIVYMPEEPEKWDLMLRFADYITDTEQELVDYLGRRYGK